MLESLMLDHIPRDHPVAHFARFWQAGLNDTGVFDRRTFNPMRVPNVLPWILILEPEYSESGARQYRYKLSGSRTREIFNEEMTGHILGHGIQPELKKRLSDEMTEVLATNTPSFSTTGLPFIGRDFIRVYRGVFPFAKHGDVPDQICAVLAEVKLVTRGL